METIFTYVLNYKSFFALLTCIYYTVNGFTSAIRLSSCVAGEPYTLVAGVSVDGCVGTCVNSRHCQAVQYERHTTVCRLYSQTRTVVKCAGHVVIIMDDTDKTIPGECTGSDCPITDCGPIPSVDYMDVAGNQASVNSVVKYTCQWTAVTTYVTCVEDGSWSEKPVCNRTAMNGAECMVGFDCQDPHAICVKKNIEDSTGHCFCEPNYRYNNLTTFCDIGCTLSSSFDEMFVSDEHYIESYGPDHSYAEVDTLQECWDYCNTTYGDTAQSAEMWKEKKIKILQRLLSDIIILAAGGIALLLFRVSGNPYKRGFFCDDESLMYPYKDSTVSSAMLYGIGFALALALMLIIEGIWVHCSSRKRPQQQTDIDKYGRLIIFIRDVYLAYVPFVFGAIVEHIVTDIGKYSVGRLRPHFRDVCNIDLSKVNCSAGYIADFQCNSDETNKLREMRLSFPSGHASFSTFAAMYIIIYLQRRLTFLFRSLIRPLVQLLVFSMAWYTCLSRITDNKHHPTDVLGGAVIGTGSAIIVSYCVSDLFDSEDSREKDRTHYTITPQSTQSSDTSTSSTQSTKKATYF